MDRVNPDDIQARPSFRLANVPVRVSPDFFFVSVVLGLSGRPEEVAAWVAVVSVSVLVHELGHAFAIRVFGGSPSILLYAGGGLTYGSTKRTPLPSIAVSLAGPLAGFALAGLTVAMYRFVPHTMMIRKVYENLIWVNVGWGLFNLLPLLPLDGGHVFESLLSLRWPSRARFAAELVTCVTSLVVLVMAYQRNALTIGLFAVFWALPTWASTWRKVAYARDRKVIEEVPKLQNARFHGHETVAARGAELLGRARTKEGRRMVAAELVLLHFECGEQAAAHELILAYFGGVELPEAVRAAKAIADHGLASEVDSLERATLAYDSVDMLSLYLDACAILDLRERCVAALRQMNAERVAYSIELRATRHFHQGRFEESLLLSEVGAVLFESATHAYNAGCCLTRLERLDEAFAALEQAILWEKGWPAMADSDPDLVPLHDDPRWHELREAHAVA